MQNYKGRKAWEAMSCESDRHGVSFLQSSAPHPPVVYHHHNIMAQYYEV